MPGTLGKALNKSDKDPPGANKQTVSIIEDNSAVIGGRNIHRTEQLPALWGNRVLNSSGISPVY